MLLKKVVMNKLTPERRSENMRCIRGTDTGPKLAVRKLAVFVHGCFWHGHDCAEGIRKPKSNQVYWIPKIERNWQRDIENIAALKIAGWSVLVIWECEITEKYFSLNRLQNFLSIQ